MLDFFDRIAKGYNGEYTEDINRQFLDFLFHEESMEEYLRDLATWKN